MKHSALTVLALWTSTFTLINSGGSAPKFSLSKNDLLSVSMFDDTKDSFARKRSSDPKGLESRDLFGAAIEHGQIGRLERKRRTLPGRQQTHKNSKISEESQINPLEFISSGHGNVSNKKHKKSQHVRKQSHKNTDITQGRRSIFGISKKGHKNKNQKICSESETGAEDNIRETRRNIQNTMKKNKNIERNGQKPHNISMKKNKDIEALIQGIAYRAENISAGNETKPENQTNSTNTTKESDSDSEEDPKEVIEKSRVAKKYFNKSLLLVSKIIDDTLGGSGHADKESKPANEKMDSKKVEKFMIDSLSSLIKIWGKELIDRKS